MIRAVYFDLDDTLCGYWAASRQGLTQAMVENGIDPEVGLTTWRNVFKTFSKEVKTDKWYAHYLESGEPTRTEHLRRTLRDLKMESEELAQTLSHRYAELRNEKLTLFPDALPLLDLLRHRFPLGLITNGPADIQRQEVRQLGIEAYFGQILIEGEFKAGKPSIEIFRAAEIHSGLQAKEMLFVGNAYEHDVQGAKNAGWQALWLNRGDETDPGSEPRPDKEIAHLYEVCDWLEIARPAPEPPRVSAELTPNWR